LIGRRRPLVRRSVALVGCCVLVAHPTPSVAAFDLRRATPEALGAASMDFPFDLLGDPPKTDPSGAAPRRVSILASHASLYQVAGLAADRVQATWGLRPVALELCYERTGTPDIAESIASLSVREPAARAVSLHGRVERLSLNLPQEPETSGWAAGFGVTARARARRLTF
jgi:hypothetical protein